MFGASTSGGIKIGSLLGFPIHIRLSFLFLMGIAAVVWRSPEAVVMLLCTFAMVLLHELGHAVVARRLQVPILGIELTIFGGVARMGGMPRTPRDEILIAAAGPAVSLALALLSHGLALVFSGAAGSFLGTLALINLVLAGFNLLPALPMDGGRIFRAAMAGRLGRLRATNIAVKVSRALAALMMLWAVGGIWPLYRPSLLLAALAAVLWMMAGAELRAAQFWTYFGQPETPQPGADARGDMAGTQGAMDVEVLGQDGRPVTPPAEGRRPGGFSVEEHRAPGVHRWVVRGPDGKILFVSETPLRW